MKQLTYYCDICSGEWPEKPKCHWTSAPGQFTLDFSSMSGLQTKATYDSCNACAAQMQAACNKMKDQLKESCKGKQIHKEMD